MSGGTVVPRHECPGDTFSRGTAMPPTPGLPKVYRVVIKFSDIGYVVVCSSEPGGADQDQEVYMHLYITPMHAYHACIPSHLLPSKPATIIPCHS